MKCGQCGFDNKDGINFCVQCGKKLDNFSIDAQEVQDAQEIVQTLCDTSNQASGKRKLKKKIIIPIIAGAVVLCAVLSAVFLIMPRSAKNGYLPYYEERTTIFTTVDGTLILYDGRIIETVDELKDIYTTREDKILFYIDDDVLYCVNKGNVTKCATDAESFATGSIDGRYVFYLDTEKTVWRYDSKKSEKVKVFEEDDDSAQYIMAASNSGEILVYSMIWINYDSIDIESYVWEDGKKQRLKVEDFVAASISDDGKSMYGLWAKGEGKFGICAVKDGEKMKLTSDVDVWSDVYIFDNRLWFRKINEYGNQLMFTSSESTYVSIDYGEKQKVCSDEIESICGYATSDFRSAFYKTASDSGTYSLYYLNNDLEMQSVAKKIASDLISLDGTTVVYKKGNGGLYKVTSDKLDEEEKIASDVKDFVISFDGETVYYIGEDSALYVSKDAEKECLLDEVHSLYITPDDDVYVIVEYDRDSMGGELYHIMGNQCEKVQGASNVNSVRIVGQSVYYKSNGSQAKDGTIVFDLYVKHDSKEFKMIYDGVE